MGIKIKGKNLLFCLLAAFAIITLTTGTKTFAQTQPPQQIVKVAISNNNFQTLAYKEINIIAQSEFFVFDKKTCTKLTKIAAADVLKVRRTPEGFELSVGGKVVAKNSDNLIIDSPKGLLGVQNLKRSGKQAWYHGCFEINKKNDTQFMLVNSLDIQSYLKGVVPNEMPVRFGLEALKAQSVAARNYVLTPRTRSSKEFDVDDSVASQVYFGANTEQDLSNQAVDQTEGLVALYNWELILAQYSSTAGGYTENYENAFSDPKTGEFPPSKTKPYLQGRPDIYNVAPLNREDEARLFYMGYPDSYDMKSPYYRWKKEWKTNELRDVLNKTLVAQSKTGFVKPKFNSGDTIKELVELRVKRRGVSGKVMELEIVTDKEVYHVYKELVVRRLLQKDGVSLPSANVVFDNLLDADKKLNKIVAYGGGFGHGVGMSQYGAGFMATSLHKSFDKILKRYYSGITISTCPVILSDNESQQSASQTFYAPKQKAFLVVDNKYQITKLNGNINGKEVNFEFERNFAPTHRINRIDISNYVRIGKNTATFYYPKECGGKKALRLYIELVEKDNDNYNF